MSNVGYATVSIIPSAKGFRRNLEREIGPSLAAVGATGSAKAGSTAGRRFGASFVPAVGRFAKTGLLAVGVAGGVALGAGIKTGLKTASFLEQAKISFKTLLGPGGDAEGYITSLTNFAKSTPFELPGVVDAARKLLGNGTAAKQVIPTLTALGDATSALGLNQEDFAGIVRAVTQVQAKGKVYAEEALQIAERGLPIYPLLARAMGKTVPQIQAMMKDGKLLAKDALPALYKQMHKDYGGAMVAQSKTLAGTWSNVKDSVSIALAKGLAPLVPVLTRVLPPAANALAGAITAISNGASVLFGKIGPVKDALAGLFGKPGTASGGFGKSLLDTFTRIKEFGASLIGPLKEVGTAIMGALGPGIKSVVSTLQTTFLPAFRAILPVLQPVAAFIIRILGGAVVGIIKGAFNVINGVLKIIGGLFKVIASAVRGDWSGMWEGIKTIASGVMQAVWGAIQVWWNLGILGAFKRIGLSVLGSFKGLWSGLKGAASGGMNAVKGFISGGLKALWSLFTGAVKGYIGIWKGLFSAVRTIAVNGWRVLRSAFGGALAAIRSVVSGALSAIGGFFSRTFAGIKGAVSRGFTSARTAVSQGISKVVGLVSGLPGKALAALKGIGSTLASAGRSLIDGFIGGIADGFAKVKRKLGELTSLLPDWKGPAALDKVILRDNGRLVIGGFVDGLESEYGSVKRSLAGLTSSLPVTTAASGLGFPQSAVTKGAATASGGAPLVGSLTLESRGNAKDDLEEALFQLRRIQRGGIYA